MANKIILELIGSLIYSFINDKWKYCIDNSEERFSKIKMMKDILITINYILSENNIKKRYRLCMFYF